MSNTFLSVARERLIQNWKSGLTVSLVSLPLSVSLAVASQTTPIAGIITAVWAGLITAIFGGSNFNIVGPTGALSGILASYALMHGAPSLSMVALVSAGFILLAYLFRLERFLVFVPASTMHGFTLAVGLVIGLNQLNFATGLTGLTKHETFLENVWESLTHLSLLQPMAVVVFLVFLAALFILVKRIPKIPGAILLTPFGILLGYAATHRWLPFTLQTLGSKYPDLAPRLWQQPQFFWDHSLLMVGFTVALVAILETMISAKIADQMTKTTHNGRKELLGLGLANIMTGMMGGIPATAALARTSANIKSGANHKTSAGISAVCIALASAIFLGFFRYLPLPVIAAILVFIALRMVEVHHFTQMFRKDRLNFWLALGVAAICVIQDPVFGIAFGTAASLLVFAERTSHGQFEIRVNDAQRKIVQEVVGEQLPALDPQADLVIYSIKGALVYLNGQAHTQRLAACYGCSTIVLRLRELSYMDMDGVEVFNELIEQLERMGKRVLISGVNPCIRELVEDSRAYRVLVAKHAVFGRTSEALRTLGVQV